MYRIEHIVRQFLDYFLTYIIAIFSSLTFSVHECSAMMTIAAWASNEAIPGALPVWHP